ncbi:hypothetical protein ACIQRS_19340 [Streptomyces termitum]|uniref:Uncharacterized protein n=1 Tax=Streptomyces termitum TaxID=67368 RepID=A0A918T4V3_9ACTN|nr:hypothetical protein [Streptomyces termitum]GHA95673.1 hypothetical protein GCM10010305_44140 [Streptomyces termitum]
MTRRAGPAPAVAAPAAEVPSRPGPDGEPLLPRERRRLARARVPGRRDDVRAARPRLRLRAAVRPRTTAARLLETPPQPPPPRHLCRP